MCKKLTTEEFIEKSRKVHGDKYDYSKVEYVNNKNKVIIICPEHGEFEQTAGKHVMGACCRVCSYVERGSRRAMPFNDFLRKARELHGNTYKYKEPTYTNSTDKMIIICPIHGEYEQSPQVHLRGCGCTHCRSDKISKSSTEDTEYFINKSKSIYGDRYSYENTLYVNALSPIVVTCRQHGDFEILKSASHLSTKRVGCPECSKIELKESLSNIARLKRNWNFEQPEDYKLVPLTQGKFAIVDNEDFDKVKDINWAYSKGYAKNRFIGSMQNYIMNVDKSTIVDHIRHNTLDNRKSELRVSDKQKNSWNQQPRKGSKSQYSGVWFDKKRSKWVGEVKKDGKKYYVGGFDNEVECAKARDKRALELFGDYGYLNFPELKEEYLKDK